MALFEKMFGRKMSGKKSAEQRTGTPSDLLVVGLGNPGEQYAGTRHNVGVAVLDVLAERYGGQLRKGRELALADELRISGQRVAIAFPQTYMNESGQSVRKLVTRYGITDLDRLIVVHDELDLPVGRIMVKVGGGLAGHNGLKSIKAHLHTADFLRIRVGVGRPEGRQSGADYVLRRPGKRELEDIGVAVERSADAVETILADGVDRAMETFNRK